MTPVGDNVEIDASTLFFFCFFFFFFFFFFQYYNNLNLLRAACRVHCYKNVIVRITDAET